ncbi:hypothetical protein Tco_0572282 [Tanacetum coccineum]
MPTFGTPGGTFTQTAFSQPAFSQPIFSQPAVHCSLYSTFTTLLASYPNIVQTQQIVQQVETSQRVGKMPEEIQFVHTLRVFSLMSIMGHSYGVKVAAAPTHSAFISAASSGSKLNYSNQHSSPSGFQPSVRSDSIMECVLHSFVAENEPDQDMIYEDFDS